MTTSSVTRNLFMTTEKLHSFDFHAKLRCNLNNISYFSETQKNNFNSYNDNFFPNSFS